MLPAIRDNRFGLFIHWGVYALTEWQEQAIARYDMKNEDYEQLMHRFDPVEYDPAEWVRLAKDAGMSYICFTAKHHDGFCMWDTKETSYNIMNTPYGKDVLKMLADECHKQGMRLSIYYSNPDWHHPYGYNPASTHQWKSKNKTDVDTEAYRAFIKAQVTELLTGYGPIYTFFWDIPPRIEDPSLNELVRQLQPGIYINDRGWSEGDFSTPERGYSEMQSTRFARMTEACNSVGQQSWGYRRGEDFYTKRHLCCSIDRYMAQGASYLLNVGPNARGVITKEYRDALHKVSDWYNRMQGCLECADADPFVYDVRDETYIATRKEGKTYLHFYDGLSSSAALLRHFPSVPKEVRLMNTGAHLPFEVVTLPEFFDMGTGLAEPPHLRISGIPADDLSDEPIVLAITW